MDQWLRKYAVHVDTKKLCIKSVFCQLVDGGLRLVQVSTFTLILHSLIFQRLPCLRMSLSINFSVLLIESRTR